jgi:hypothetical protein
MEEMGDCSTHGKYEMLARSESEYLKGSAHLGGVGTDGRTIPEK